MREIKYRGISQYTGEMVYGQLLRGENDFNIVTNFSRAIDIELIPIKKGTQGQYTGLKDKNGREIYEGDVTELEVDGEIRRFVVKIKTVIREVVSHPSFNDDTAKVAITGVVFEWNGFELFPCVDENGEFDNTKMVVIGNIYKNPELLEVNR